MDETNKKIKLTELEKEKLFVKARRGNVNAQKKIVFGMRDGIYGFEENPDKLFDLAIKNEHWIQRWYHSLFWNGAFFQPSYAQKKITELAEAGFEIGKRMLMQGLLSGKYFITPDEEKYNHYSSLGWTPYYYRDKKCDPFSEEIQLKAENGDQETQKSIIEQYIIWDNPYLDLFESLADKDWFKDWYHYIFTSDLYDKEFAKGRLIDLAEEGDSQARQMLAAAYFKGVYNFEQDFDKFKELCDLGWPEALEIKKKFFDVFDKSQTEKTN